MLPVLRNRGLIYSEPLDWVDREFGRLARQFWGDGNGSAASGSLAIAYPADMWEDEDAVHVTAELPGFTKDQIEITIDQGMLHISAERTMEQRDSSKGSTLLNERRYSRYQRSFTLPTSVDDAKVDANFADGVLQLTLPKSPEVKPRKIKVK